MSIFEGDGSARPEDYLARVRNTRDTYPYGVPHGVQKDAIQNGMDARVGGQRLKFTFELIRNEKGRFLTMSDENTIGLTGPVLRDQDYAEELPEDARWARFESLGFMNPNPAALGARGQGKLIFLAGSKEQRMIYETLRADGIYRVGGTEARRTGCPVFPGPKEEPWEGERGKEILESETGLAPLTRQGTRIIIVDPTDEVVESIRDGSFIKAIEETWFRSIGKNQAKIAVMADGQRTEAEVPDLFPIPDRDTKSIKTWILGKDTDDRTIRTRQGSYRVKHLRIAYNERDAIPEEHCGIAIIHNGMKICCLSAAGDVPTPEVMRLFPPDKRRRVYGFVEFDKELDRELRREENQKPNHYELNWIRALPKAIKEYIARQCAEFGDSKLGLGIHPTEQRTRTRQAAEEWALRELSRHAKDLRLFGGRGISPPPDGPPPPPRPLGVRIHNFNFPVPERRPRVNWGESISGFSFVPFNRTDNEFVGYMDASVLYGDTEILWPMRSQTVKMRPHETLKGVGRLKIEFSEKDFPEKGEYRLRVRLKNDQGDRVDEQTRRIWVEDDPTFRGPFAVQGEDFSEYGDELKDLQWIEEGHVGNYALVRYNVKHPAYRLREEQGLVSQREYLFEIFLEAAMALFLGRPATEDGTPDLRPLDQRNLDADPLSAYREIIGKIAEIRRRSYAERLR